MAKINIEEGSRKAGDEGQRGWPMVRRKDGRWQKLMANKEEAADDGDGKVSQ